MPYEQEEYVSPSSVDCTLSLGTPSTRLTNDYEKTHPHDQRSSWWNILQSSSKSPAPQSTHKANRGGGNGSATADSLFSRRFKKEERRANAAAAAVVTSGGSDATEGYHHHQYMMNGNQWVNHHSQPNHKMPSCYSPAAAANEYRFMDDVDDRDSPFLSWRLNVTDRPGLVHDFTR
ncbi:hypothetical protein Ccrd_012797 [Cynara cardunculus var. scolymus]|uniref:Uncharacterized protein n=1 Tax=Cynara cardunculus var. scolymus TaxID=59895 RepID=A0A103YGT9_CYNCS|nr:hypothetical protein Ccrd_012797 [Cynara cardunculus var. scolymus]